MHVKLIGYTSDPEKLPAMAATLTHSKTKPEDLGESTEKQTSSHLGTGDEPWTYQRH